MTFCIVYYMANCSGNVTSQKVILKNWQVTENWSEVLQNSIRANSQRSSCSQTRCCCGNSSSWTCLSSLWQNLRIGLWSLQSYSYSSMTAQLTLHQCNIVVEIIWQASTCSV